MNKFKFAFIVLSLSLISLTGFKASAQYNSFAHCAGSVFGNTYVYNVEVMRCNWKLTQEEYEQCHHGAAIWANNTAWIVCNELYY